MTRQIVTMYLPDGYKDAEEFAKDCGFEFVQDCGVPDESAMHDLICAIIEDDASYDTATNTWETSKAATAIIAALRGNI